MLPGARPACSRGAWAASGRCWRSAEPPVSAAPLPAARSRSRTRLLRVVEGEPHDLRRNPLLQPVELADLDRGADLGVLDRHPAERERALQRRATRAAGDHAHLTATRVHRVSVAGHLVALELEPDEPALRVLLALLQRRAADEVLLAGERYD